MQTGVIVGLFSLYVGGCAGAGDPSNGGPVGDAGWGTASMETGTGDDEDGDSKQDDPYDSTSGGDDDDRDDRDGASTGEDGDDDESGSTGDVPAECDNDLLCGTAMNLGQVSGDSDSTNLSLSGDTPTWVKFYVTEDEDGVGGQSLSVQITLNSPADADFDLFVEQGPAGSDTPCGGETSRSTEDGGPDQVDLSWGESAVANGADDSAWIAVEIRPKNDECLPGEHWNLTVQGNF